MRTTSDNSPLSASPAVSSATSPEEYSARLRERLPEYARVQWVAQTGSTNADLLQDSTAPAYSARITGHQLAGRGRLGRPWVAPAGAQATMSVLIRPTIAQLDQAGTIPLAAGLAVIDAISALALKSQPQASVELKWPNDVLLNGRKLSGILAEAAGIPEDPRIVIGLGINVALSREQLPVEHATSLALEGIAASVEEVSVAVLSALVRRLKQWESGGRELMEHYRGACITIGKPVRVQAPTGDLEGVVDGVAQDGRIELIDASGKRHFIAAGDVTHLRRTDGNY